MLRFTGPYQVQCQCAPCGAKFSDISFDQRDLDRVVPAICARCRIEPPKFDSDFSEQVNPK